MEAKNLTGGQMKSLDSCEIKRQTYIEEILKTELIGYTNQRGEIATFDDMAWRYIYPDGTSINLLFYDCLKTTGKKIVYFGAIEDAWKLEETKGHLLMGYALDIIAEGSTLGTKQGKLREARRISSECSSDWQKLTQEQLDDLFHGLNTTGGRYRRSFIKWLSNNGFIRPSLKLKPLISDNDGYDKIEVLAKKLPKEGILVALGAIFYDVINPDEEKWNRSPIESQRDAFVCTMSALAMASPNRVAAEQIALANQYIKKQTLESGQSIHWLDWQGSKGYKDNQNHLLANMIEPLNRALKYIRKVTEPARILAKFYEAPKTAINNLFGEFEPLNINKVNIDHNKPVHIFQLGYLLGFYDGEDTVTVCPKTPNAYPPKGRGAKLYRKKICELSDEDRIIISENTSVKDILGAHMKQTDIDLILGNKKVGTSIKVCDFQNKWIEHIKRTIPSFPYNSARNGGKVKYSMMMFAFTGKQIAKSSSGVIGQLSWFHLVKGTQLSSVLSIDLGGSKISPSIFEKFGFAKTFKITPHQFRHWLNDTGDKEGIPHRILNLWSGRNSPEQLLNYVHSTEGERASVIRDILFKDERVDEDNILPIKVHSQSEYEALAGIGDGISTATSTGFCVQNLLTSQCEYMNDFETQCTLCSNACHIKGDEEALDLLRRDCEFQTQRLNLIESKPIFSQSNRMKGWFKVHYRNVALLKELVGLLEDPDIKIGSVIRVFSSQSEIRITDLNLKLVNKRKLSLPCAKSALEKIIDDISSSQSNDDNTLNNLLSMIPEAE